MEDLGPLRLHVDARSAVELVLAEALNNVVEHAYRNLHGSQAQSFIDLRITQDNGVLRVVLRDRGRPMPDHALPGRTATCGPNGARAVASRASAENPCVTGPDRTTPLHHLPEGGFGWFLIAALTEDVTYERVNGENRLAMVLRTVGAAGSRSS